MNVYKPLIIFNTTHSITLLTDGCVNFVVLELRHQARSKEITNTSNAL
jgi:fumarate hydratase class II